MRSSVYNASIKRYLSYFISCGLLAVVYMVVIHGIHRLSVVTIIVITPTYKRPERLAEMTRISQTLSHINDLHWIVIEDANETVKAVQRILNRSGLKHVYFYTTTQPGFPKRGWTHRNEGLKYIRKNYQNFRRPAVVYFADDDNTYDIRLFNYYIRNVKTIGFWAVGLSGKALVEAPHVQNGKIVSWDVVYAPDRTFATDMAGFAVNLELILKTKAVFRKGCKTPEDCFLKQFNISLAETQAFGYNEIPKEILVWHTQAKKGIFTGDRHGYEIE
ncbi:unnamed protein product [Thelazia callipaeda]|uniref:Galactosylgalactosylxylosylprotein 3-beta-glucuronosyltransferase n=1 Tax=Thelazia callipaeda TaxID=103827 RepID=A0A0N5CZI8_THECL|nr:unnamed protein product [Thelazia callipaeda]